MATLENEYVSVCFSFAIMRLGRNWLLVVTFRTAVLAGHILPFGRSGNDPCITCCFDLVP